MNAKATKSKANDQFNRINGYLLNAVEDSPDFRDFDYRPALVQLKDRA